MKAHVLNSLGLAPISDDGRRGRRTRRPRGWTATASAPAERCSRSAPPKTSASPTKARAPSARSGAASRRGRAVVLLAALPGRGRALRGAGSTPARLPVQRRVCGAYLTWVLARASDGVEVVQRARRARVARAARGPLAGRRRRRGSGPCRATALQAFALTGPGVHRTILPHDLDAAARVLDCDSGRIQIARVPVEESSDIAIVGGGESALSCIEFVRARRPDAQLTVYTANLPMSRVESFSRTASSRNPDDVDWPSLSVQTRRDFIARSRPRRVRPRARSRRSRMTSAAASSPDASRTWRRRGRRGIVSRTYHAVEGRGRATSTTT
jgi:hypothetical protein